MKTLLFLSILRFDFAGTPPTKPDTMHHQYTYLALGDSYTIGEGVPLHRNFPYQTVDYLRTAGYSFQAPDIVARTGWTTDELETATDGRRLLPKYDFVTLLAGVNNQYRGQTIAEYKQQFERLLKKAISLADGKAEHVVVISIPDYGVTPFGQRMDAGKIEREIDAYNTLNRALSVQYKTKYLDITGITREGKNVSGAVVADGLHPSEEEYKKWAKLLMKSVKDLLKK